MNPPAVAERPSDTRDRVSTWSVFAIALAVFLLLRPYDGIVHDARLYVGYVLAAWDPQGVGQDIMFVHDGQSGYSVYPLLLGLIGRLVGLSNGAMTLSFAALLIWFAAAWRLVWALFPTADITARAGLLLWATSLHTLYGGASTIHIAENFATPRPLAEALVLFALSFLVQSDELETERTWVTSHRTAPAIALVSLAGLVHPLLIVPGLAALLWLRVDVGRRSLIVAGVAVMLCAMLALSTGLHTNAEWAVLLATFDTAWLEMLQRRGSIALAGQWHALDWVRIAVQLSTLLVTRPLVQGRVRGLWDAMLVAGLAGVVLTWLATDVVHHRLLTQVQPWRVLWAVAFLSPLALLYQLRVLLPLNADSAVDSDVSNRRGLELCATLLLLLAWIMLEVSSAAGWILACALVLHWLARRGAQVHVSRQGLRVCTMLVAVLVVALVLLRAFVVWEVYTVHPDSAERWVWRTLVTSGVPNAVVLLGALVAVTTTRTAPLGGSWRRLLPPVVAGLLWLWLPFVADQRTGYVHWLEKQITAKPEDSRHRPVSMSGAALWLDADLEPWVLLRRPAWGGVLQGTPKVFDRSLAMAWEQRAALIDRIAPPDWARRSDLALALVDSARLAAACQWPDGPRWVVSPLDRIAAGIPRDTLRTGATRYLPPNVRGGAWRVVTQYGIMACTWPNEAQRPS